MRALGWMVAGFAIGAVLAFGIGIALPEITPISQREGAYAMAVAFVYTPIGGVIGAVAGLIRALRR